MSITNRLHTIVALAVSIVLGHVAFGAGIPLPGTVNAAAFSVFYDIDSGVNNNIPGPDLETCSEGGQDVGWINATEWLEYNVVGSESAILSVTARVASPSNPASMDLLLDGTKVASCTGTSSGDWQTWKDATFTATITLQQGQAAKLRIVFTGGGFNLEKLTFTKIGAPPFLSVDTSNATFASAGGAKTVQVTSNTTWAAASDAAWITVSPTTGINNGTLSLTASANTGPARSAMVNVVGAGITRSVGVTQAALPTTPPTITAIANQSVFLNAATPAIAFTIGDAETPPAALTLQASSDTPSLIPLAAIVFGGSGANRTVTITPAAGQTGTATVGIQVSDTNGGTAAIQFTVSVRDANGILDRNGDGISDVWAALYPNAGGPTADPDGDGQSNLVEARAGTDPTNPASRFIATAALDASGNICVRWQSIAGKYYFLEATTDMTTWTPLPGEYTGTGAQLSAIVHPAGTVTGTRTFWHVVVFDMDSTGSGLNDWEKTHLDKVAAISATAGANGSINPSGKSYIAKGGSLTFTVTPAVGYLIDQVQVDGQGVGAVSTYPFTSIGADHTIGATFKTTATLTVAPASLNLTATASTGSATVSASGSWTVSSDSNWLTVSPLSGSGNATLTFAAAANTSVARTATVSVQSGALSKQVSITQARGPSYYFKNRWTGTYMYDAGDRVGYGTTNADDTYKWTIEDLGNGQKEIRNVGTGDYIHIQDLADWAQCGTRTSGWTRSRWTFDNTGDGFTRFKNVGNSDRYLHVENLKGYVQEGTAVSTWYSAQWTQEVAPDPLPPGATGMVGNGIALFVPQGLDAAHLPTSLALAAPVSIQSALPGTWQVTPVFSQAGSGFKVTVPLHGDEDLYGTGEVTGSLRRNGKTITLWNTDNFTYAKDNGQRLYQSHPWVLGVRPDGSSFGVLFDSTWRATLTCSTAITFSSEGPALPVYVIDRASPAEVLKGLAELTGTMAMPPKWALGYQQCRYSYHPDSRVREIADTFRSKSIPCDVVWMDIDYMDGFRIFTFRPDEFPDPAGLSNYLHQRGFKGVWMIDPGVKVDSGFSVYTSGQQQDVYVKTAAGGEAQGDVWPGACAFPDFTRPATRTWWAGLYAPFMAKGVDGVWNDMNEPATFNGPDGTLATDSVHRGGGDLPAGPHLQYHNAYGLLMVKASREGILAANPTKRPFVLSRANFLGGHRYAATWTGDNSSTYEHMALAAPMSLNLSLSGQPFNGPDLGGFAGDATGELWASWVGMGAFFPFCRGHACAGTNDKEPWAFGASTENAARIALQRRYRLMPYLYTVFREAATTGLPVMRPLFMADATNAALRQEQTAFLVGADLMVVPRESTSTALPAWPEASLISGDLSESHQAHLRIRPGAIVPLGKVIQSTTEESLDPLTLMISFDANDNAEGTLYEDAGDGFGYVNGDYLLTRYRAERRNGQVSIRVLSSEGFRPRPVRTVVAQILTGGGNVQTIQGLTGL